MKRSSKEVLIDFFYKSVYPYLWFAPPNYWIYQKLVLDDYKPGLWLTYLISINIVWWYWMCMLQWYTGVLFYNNMMEILLRYTYG